MAPPVEKSGPNPGLSAVLSFLFSGMGQIYNGQIKKGLVIVFFSSLSLLLVIVGAVLIGYYALRSFSTPDLVAGIIFLVVGVIAIAVLGIYSIYEAYGTAKAKLVEKEQLG